MINQAGEIINIWSKELKDAYEVQRERIGVKHASQLYKPALKEFLLKISKMKKAEVKKLIDSK